MVDSVALIIEHNDNYGFETWARETPGIRGFGGHRAFSVVSYLSTLSKEIPDFNIATPFTLEDLIEEELHYLGNVFESTGEDSQYRIQEKFWNTLVSIIALHNR